MKSQNKKTTSAGWVKALMGWFAVHKRTMPWRDKPSSYAVWISEIMLQQTRVDTVIPYFRRFIRQFPSVRKLAAADLQSVLKVWEGLGYYTRARNLHRAAQEVMSRHGGRVPATFDEWLALPGIGEYTAAAIASISAGHAVPAVDGNVIRVMTRFLGITENSTKGSVQVRIRTYLSACIPVRNAGDFNQAMMELGALVCRPKNPLCPECPLRRECVALKTGQTGRIPVRPKRKPVPHYDVVACVIWKKGKILITKRRADQMLGGLWEFPGGKCNPGETLKAAAHREIREETGMQIKVGRRLCVVKHAYSHFAVTLHAMECRHVHGRALARASDGGKWISVRRLRDYPFPAGDRRIIELLEDQESGIIHHKRTQRAPSFAEEQATEGRQRKSSNVKVV